MGLLEPVCLFWHKIPSDWQLRLDIPPAATTHAWLVMKNISSSSWLHTRHTKKICSHAEQRPMTQVLYKSVKSNFESYGNMTVILFRQHVESMETNGIVNESVIIFARLSEIWLCTWNYLSHSAEYCPHLMDINLINKIKIMSLVKVGVGVFCCFCWLGDKLKTAEKWYSHLQGGKIAWKL